MDLTSPTIAIAPAPEPASSELAPDQIVLIQFRLVLIGGFCDTSPPLAASQHAALAMYKPHSSALTVGIVFVAGPYVVNFDGKEDAVINALKLTLQPVDPIAINITSYTVGAPVRYYFHFKPLAFCSCQVGA